jgi:hypothetical protein
MAKLVTLPDNTSKNKCNHHVLEPRLKERSIQNNQYDKFNIKLHSDDSSTVNSLLPSPLVCNGGGDESLLAPQQGSHVRIPTENLLGDTGII